MNKLKTTALAVIAVGLVLGISSAQVTTSSCYQFERNLRVGNTGADVKALQQTLNANGFTVAAAGHAGSAGMETTYFGNATKMALIKWQEANAATTLAPWGLTSGTGFFGATSRAEMNKCAPGTPTTPGTGTVSGAVSVSLAQVQPNNVLVEKASHAKLADFVFSGTGIVSGVKLQRTGISNNDSITNIVLYEGNTRIAEGVDVMFDGTINFNNGVGIFSVTGSKVISVYADVAANTSGQSVGVALTGLTVAGNPAAVVSGVNGPHLPIGKADIAVTSLATGYVNPKVDVGNTNVNLWDVTLTNQSSVYFKGLNLTTDSLPSGAIANVKLYINGVQIGNAITPDQTGRLAFAGDLFLNAGNHSVSVRADIVGGAGKDFTVSLEEKSDILLQDAQLAGVYSSIGTVTPIEWSIEINSCSTGDCVYLSPDSTFNGAKSITGASGQTIGKFVLTSSGEPVTLQSTDIKVTGGNTQEITNVTLSVNGTLLTYGSKVTLDGVTKLVDRNLGNYPVLLGQNNVIEVKADLRTSTGTNLLAQPAIKVELDNFKVKGTQSGKTSTTSAMSNPFEVTTFDATLAKNAAASIDTLTANESNVKIGSFIMSSGVSPINLNEITVDIVGATPFALNQLSNLRLESSGLSRTTSVSASSTFSNLAINMNANETRTFDVYANLTNASGTMTLKANAKYWSMNSNHETGYSDTFSVTFGDAAITGVNLETNQASKAQFVTGGTIVVSDFLVSSANSGLAINEMEFLVKDNPSTVSNVSVNGVNASSLGAGKYKVSGLSISVSSGFGTKVPVAVTFVGPTTGNGLSKATTTVQITKITTNKAGVTYTTPARSTNEFTSAMAIPTSVVVSSNTVNSGTAVSLGKVTVETTGTIRVKEIPLNVAIANSGVITSTSSIQIKKGGTILSATISGSTSSPVITITGGGDLVSGSAEYEILANVGSMTQSGSAGLSLGASSAFKWNDSANDFTGEFIKTY